MLPVYLHVHAWIVDGNVLEILAVKVAVNLFSGTIYG